MESVEQNNKTFWIFWAIQAALFYLLAWFLAGPIIGQIFENASREFFLWQRVWLVTYLCFIFWFIQILAITTAGGLSMTKKVFVVLTTYISGMGGLILLAITAEKKIRPFFNNKILRVIKGFVLFLIFDGFFTFINIIIGDIIMRLINALS